MIRAFGALLAACLLLAACGTPAGIRHTEVPLLSSVSKPSFDQAIVDQAGHRLYVADGGLLGIDVFDVKAGKPLYLTTVKIGRAPHGLALASDLHKLFAGIDGGAVAVIEADPAAKSANTVLATIQTSAKKNVDLIDYDSRTHVLWAASSDEGVLTKIDAIRNLPLVHLTLAAGLEQPRFNSADQRLYLPNMTKNLLYQIDPNKLVVTKQWSLGVPCAPTGMAIDAKRKVALLGCSDPSIAYTLEWDLAAAKQVRTFTQVGSADQVVYDQANDLYLVAGVSAGSTAVGFFGGSPVAYRSSKITHADVKGGAIDDASRVVFTPDAHPGEVGLVSFDLPPDEVAAPPLIAPLLYLLPLLLVALAVWYYGRRRQQQRRLSGRPMYS